jgi:hypothetical protein
MRECRTYGSVRGALGNGRLYRDHVPIYLHPANPMTIPAAFEGYPGLARAIFGWAVER